MKLYFSPNACSLASHIALREAGVPFELVKVNLANKTTAAAEDFNAINPKSYVPTLRLDDGSVLTENVALLQYIADRNPGAGLAPKEGTLQRYRLIEWLAYITSEIHKQYGVFFNPKASDAQKETGLATLQKRLRFIEPILAKQNYLTGERFSVADAYLFTVLRWAPVANLDLSQFPGIQTFMTRVQNRPQVAEALNAEKAA